MRGVSQIDAIESVPFRHEEGNEGEKIGVKRGIGAFCGAKLLKRQEEGTGLAPKWSWMGARVHHLPEISRMFVLPWKSGPFRAA